MDRALAVLVVGIVVVAVPATATLGVTGQAPAGDGADGPRQASDAGTGAGDGTDAPRQSSDPGAVDGDDADARRAAVPTSVPVPDGPPADGDVRDPPAGAGDDERVTWINNGTPERLSVGSGSVTAGYGTARIDMGATLEIADGELRGQYDAYRAGRAVEAAETDYQRRQAIHTALDGIERRIEQFRARERAAIRGYHNGTETRRELLQTFAQIHVEAGTLRASLDRLQQYTAVDYPLDQRIEYLDSDLESFRTPIRQQLADGFRGEDSVPPVHVAASRNGVVVGLVADRWYYRDAIRLDNFAPAAEDQYNGIEEVTARMEELYPWAWPFAERSSSFRMDWTASQLYVMTIPHAQGTLEVHLDGGTGNVYREVQRLRLSRLPGETVASATEDGVRVRINDTLGHDPLRISVVDATSGEPINASVRMGDQGLGWTGDDGGLWTVGTPGTTTVEVDTGREIVTLSLER